MPQTDARSYRALLAIPMLGRVIVSMQLARIAQSMVGVALVLFTLAEYQSPALAGIVTFASIFPGLIVAPIAGALLDRRGRVLLTALDYVVALTSLVAIAVLSALDLLPAPLLVVITVVSSMTSILSIVGLRSLFPLMVPRPLWERVNAVDSNGYVIATILGPPIAASLVVLLGPQVAMAAIALPFGLAALALIGVREPKSQVQTSGSLFADARAGLLYTWRNPTLRGLGFAMTTLNLAGGMSTIVIPLIVLEVLGLPAWVVGLVYASTGITGMASVFLFGRIDSRGREWAMLVIPMALSAPATALLLPASGALGPIEPGAGIALLVISMATIGLLSGPLDIALFTVRQRRTDPALLGRAFAVSMAANFLGFPVGSAITGVLATNSLTAAILLGVVACVVAAILAATLIPARAPIVERVTAVDQAT